MNRLIVHFLFFSIFLSGSVFSQLGDISTDRPDVTESPYLMDKGFFQVEAGIISQHDKPSTDIKMSELSAPLILLRYGLAKNVELRAGIDYISSKVTINDSSTSTSGLSPFFLGTKVHLFQEKGSVPETALLLGVTLPFKENSEFQSEYIGLAFRFAMQNTLSKRFSLSYNLGGLFGADSPGATGFYSVALGAVLVKKLSAFVELYGFLPEKTSPDHRFDAGFTYLVLKNLQADISGGLGISEGSPDYFLGMGLSWRLPR